MQQTVDSEQQTLDSIQQTVDGRWQTVDSIQQTVDSSKKTVDSRQQTVDSRLQTVSQQKCNNKNTSNVVLLLFGMLLTHIISLTPTVNCQIMYTLLQLPMKSYQSYMQRQIAIFGARYYLLLYFTTLSINVSSNTPYTFTFFNVETPPF